MRAPRHLLLFTFLLSLLATALPAATERKTAEFSGLTIDYSAGDEAFARDLALEYRSLAPIAPAIADPVNLLSLATLKQRRAEFLAAICRQLHLSQATPKMSHVYDSFLQIQTSMQTALTGLQSGPRYLQIWRSPELRTRLVAGETIPGITLNPNGAGATFSSPPDATSMASWRFPVLINSRDTETGPALVHKKAVELQAGVSAMAKSLPSSSACQLVLHETVENAIVENYLRSADRRWFCEGVANYVAFKVTEEILGPAAALRSYDLNAQLAQYPTLRATAHLEQWAALETQQKQNHDDRSTSQGAANYVFATEVMFKAAANDPDFLPKLFAEIGRTPRKKATIKTVYRSYEKVFHGDLRSFLPNRS